MKNKKEKQLIPQVVIEQKIFLIRGKKVMLDNDLALIYGVSTKSLNQAVKRNSRRFPEDFMFRLTRSERDEVVTNCDHLGLLKFSSQMPFAFTEQGVAMLSSVLNSERAIAVNIQIIRTFVRLREMIISNKELRIRLDKIEEKYDKRFKVIFDTLRMLLEDDKKNKKEITNTRKIGFSCKGKKSIKSRVLKSS